MTTPEALSTLRRTLKKWNREVFGDVTKTKEGLLTEIKAIHDSLDHTQTDEFLQKKEALLQELDKVLEQEETIWL